MAKPVAPVNDKAARLAAIRQRLGSIDLSSGAAGFWAPKEGKSIIRVLPGTGDMGYDYFQIVGKHEFPPDGKKSVYCPHIISEKVLPCPVCDIIDQLKTGDKASKTLADALYPRRSYWMNIIVRGEEQKGPQVFTPGIKIFTFIVNLINDPDFGDVTDLDEGFDLKIDRTGSGRETVYSVNPRPKPSPAGDPDQIAEWMGKVRDLKYVELTEDPEEDAELTKGRKIFVMPYNRIVSEYHLDNLGEDDEDAVDEEEDDEPAPPAKKKVAAPAAKVAPARKAAPIEEEDDEDEEDDEPTPPAKKKSPVQQEIDNRVAARKAVRR